MILLDTNAVLYLLSDHRRAKPLARYYYNGRCDRLRDLRGAHALQQAAGLLL